MRLPFLMIIAAALFPSQPMAQEVREVDGLTALIEAPELAGQRIRIPSVQIQNATLAFVNAQAEGGIISLFQPWVDRSDFRWLVPKCGSFEGGSSCRMTIVGDLVFDGTTVSMTNVDFELPDPNAVFDRDCQQTCLESRSGEFCDEYCDCTASDLKAEGLLDRLLDARPLGEKESSALRKVVEACSIKVEANAEE